MSARFSLSLLIALAVAGCYAAEPPADAVNNAAREATPKAPAANEAQPARARLDEIDFQGNAANAAAPADPAVVTRAWFAGRWTDTGNCTDAGNFAPNGTYLLSDGTRGMWSVQDGKLFVQHANGRGAIRLRRVDDTTVETLNDDGSVGRSTRC